MIRYTEFRNTRVRFSDTGQGRTLVLLHGFPETLQVWDEFSVKLARHFRVIAIDLPGHGETPSIGYVHSMELFAECIKTVLDSLHLRKYVLVGHSMGGYAALAFAELYPMHLSGLCLFHSTASAESDEKKRDRERVIGLVKNGTSHYLNDVIVSLFAQEHVGDYRDDIRELKHMAQSMTAQSVINAQEGMKDRPRRDGVLKSAKYPVLFIAGKKDRIVPLQVVLDQAKGIQQAGVLVLENSGHMGFMEEKKLSQDNLLRFARKCFRTQLKTHSA
jgi:pimeloyl-ACP methyl ester carboxylesterase